MLHALLVMCECMKEKVYAMEVEGHDDMINCVEVAASDFIPRKFRSGAHICVAVSCLFRCREVTLKICCDYV